MEQQEKLGVVAQLALFISYGVSCMYFVRLIQTAMSRRVSGCG